MFPRFALLALAAAQGALLLAGLIAPPPVFGHAIGEVFTLPVPLALYLAGAGVAVAASFVISTFAVKPAAGVPGYPTWPVAESMARPISLALRVIGLVWWLAAIVGGYVADPISPLPAVLFWIGIWIGVPLTAALLGNSWPSLSPFRTLAGLIEGAARLAGLRRADMGIPYPTGLGRWPAVGLLFVALWCELVLPGSAEPITVGNLLLGYSVLTVAGMLVFGHVAWLRNAELFEVLAAWFGRIGPVGRRVVDPAVCDGCTEACDPARCVDCPECSTAAEPGERRAELRPWFVGLTDVRNADASDVAFIVLALAGVTFDGLKETIVWGSVADALFPLVLDAVGTLNSLLLIQTIGLLGTWLLFLAAFWLAAALTRAVHDAARQPPPLSELAGTYATTLLPIAAGYLVAHYFTELLQGALWLPQLIANPLMTVAPLLDWFPVSAVWYLSVGAIVLGHVVAVVLAHRVALRDTPSRPVLAGLPLVVVMVGYTVLSLWIIASPITLEPGVTPAATITR